MQQNLTNMDLQNLRHLIVDEQVKASKSRFFAQQVSEPQLRDFLNQKAQKSQQNVQRLTQFVSGFQTY